MRQMGKAAPVSCAGDAGCETASGGAGGCETASGTHAGGCCEAASGARTRAARGEAMNLNPKELEKFLVNFVVEHTGYPPEIVELDADLEADLGIDSIKKAQLFGELGEYFDVQPSEDLSLDEFPTLRHVLDSWQGSSDCGRRDAGSARGRNRPRRVYAAAERAAAAAAPPERRRAARRRASTRSELETFLVNFVVEHTGYPPEIVELDADLEADLGIDSIKKAQLFGELGEYFDVHPSADLSLGRVPHAPPRARLPARARRLKGNQGCSHRLVVREVQRAPGAGTADAAEHCHRRGRRRGGQSHCQHHAPGLRRDVPAAGGPRRAWKSRRKAAGTSKQSLGDGLTGIPGVKAAVPCLQPNAILFHSGGHIQLQVLGIDPQQDRQVRDYELAEGEFFPGGRVALLEKDFARTTGLGVGDELKLLIGSGRHTVKVVGLLRAAGRGRLQPGQRRLPAARAAQKWCAQRGDVDTIRIQLEPEANAPAVREAVAQQLPAGLSVREAGPGLLEVVAGTQEDFDEQLPEKLKESPGVASARLGPPRGVHSFSLVLADRRRRSGDPGRVEAAAAPRPDGPSHGRAGPVGRGTFRERRVRV